MGNWLTRLLFDWVFVLLYRLFQSFLNLVDFIESFFDIFAGTAKVFYQGNADFLINIFFGHDAVTNAFWAMALIAIVLAFGFCIVQMARKAADVAGTVRQSVGQILSNFSRCLLIIVLLNAVTVAAINITNVLLDRINYALENAVVLDQQEADRTFTDQEYATMTRILATVANYSVNPSADSRYNVNSCFNAIRPDLLSLYVNGFFEYDYPLDENGHYTWQGALALLASSADLTQDLDLDTYYSDVTAAVQTVSREISTYPDFVPVQSAHFSVAEAIDTDVLIFLIVGMQASQNAMYDTGDFNDAIRKGYVSGEKDYNDLTQVRRDFDIWEMDYLVGYISCIVFVIIMAICIFTFIVRMFNLLLLYITAPLFTSSMPLDDGSKWQSWTQAFVIQLFSGFGMVIAMRLYLIIIPLVISSDLVFFSGDGVSYAILNRMAQLLMVLGGAWAVLQAGGVITGILAGNPGMAAIQQEGRIGGMVMGWAMRAPRAALGAAGEITRGLGRLPQSARNAQANRLDRAGQRAELASRKAVARQGEADAMFAKAERQAASGASSARVDRTMRRAQQLQKSADRAGAQADRMNLQAGRRPPPEGYGAARGGGQTDQAAVATAARAAGGYAASGSGSARAGGTSVGIGTMAPPPPRSARNPYTPEMYGGVAYDAVAFSARGAASGGSAGTSSGGAGASTGYQPRASAGARTSASERSEGAGTSYSTTVAGKRWTPPSLSGAASSAPAGSVPRAVPFPEQYVRASIPADQPRARISVPSGGGESGGSSVPPPAPSRARFTPPSGGAGGGGDSGGSVPPRRERR